MLAKALNNCTFKSAINNQLAKNYAYGNVKLANASTTADIQIENVENPTFEHITLNPANAFQKYEDEHQIFEMKSFVMKNKPFALNERSPKLSDLTDFQEFARLA